MKKSLIIIIALFLALGVNAQRLGFRAGLNLMNFSQDRYDNSEIKSGYGFGVFFQSNIFPMISLRPELGYFQNGSVITYQTSVLQVYQEMSTDNMGLIFNLRFKPPFPVYAVIGPYFSYALSGKTKTILTIGNNSSVNEGTIDFENSDLSRFDAGLSLGAGGILLNLKVVKVFIEGRYLLGMADMDKNDNYYLKNRNFTIHLGASIGL